MSVRDVRGAHFSLFKAACQRGQPLCLFSSWFPEMQSDKWFTQGHPASYWLRQDCKIPWCSCFTSFCFVCLYHSCAELPVQWSSNWTLLVSKNCFLSRAFMFLFVCFVFKLQYFTTAKQGIYLSMVNRVNTDICFSVTCKLHQLG